jgi:DNA-binding MarR family transcriptional regulator
MMARGLTKKQRLALDVLRSEPNRGFDLTELARHLDTSPEGAARSVASLWHRGLAHRFMGGVGRQRVHYQAAAA